MTTDGGGVLPRRLKVAEVLRFGTVGIVQNVINVATFAGLHAEGVGYGLAAFLAALVALAVSFVLNNYWTFARAASGRLGADLVRYSTVFSTAVMAGIVVLTIEVELLSVTPVLAQTIAILVVAPASFLAQRFWVFR